MDANELDLIAWEGVREDLWVLANAAQADHQTKPFAASALHRLATVHLRAAVIRDAEALTSGLPGADISRLQAALYDQLKGLPHEYAVLEALALDDRGEAERLIHDALVLDADFVPALQAEVALARVDARWPDAVSALHRILEIDLRPAARAYTFEVLADLHWQKLGKTSAALGYYRAALDLDPNTPERIDKLLKLNLELENWEDAVLCCHQLVALVSGHPDKAPLAVTYRLTLGEIYLYGLALPGIALRHYLYAMRLMPDYELTYTLVRELLAAHGWPALSAEYGACDDPEAPASPELFDALSAALAANSEPGPAVEALRRRR